MPNRTMWVTALCGCEPSARRVIPLHDSSTERSRVDANPGLGNLAADFDFSQKPQKPLLLPLRPPFR